MTIAFIFAMIVLLLVFVGVMLGYIRPMENDHQQASDHDPYNPPEIPPYG